MRMQTGPSILVVDDDSEIRSLLARYLSTQGFRVITAASRRELEAKLADSRVDLVVLDVMLPDGSGLDICRTMREARMNVPIILLTALKEDVDRIVGLEIGADDYLGKPFNPRELVARIKAVLRRFNSGAVPAPQTAPGYVFAGYTVRVDARQILAPDGRSVDLTGAEFDLLHAFLERPGRLLSRDQLLDLTQGRARDPMDRSIDVLISRLRRKLGDPGGDGLIRTVRNGGYLLATPVQMQEAS